jgi:hypothetical protein
MNRPFVTVVSGLPRSGTSLMMRMLSAGGMPILADDVRAADADNPLGYFEYEPVRHTARDAGWVRECPGKAVKVIYSLLRDLPAAYDYRVIVMHRDAGEVVASQAAMLRRLGRRGSDVSVERLAEVFVRELARTEEWLRTQGNVAMRAVEFEKCIRQPAEAATEVSDFLSGGLDTEAMAHAVDESLYRQRLVG